MTGNPKVTCSAFGCRRWTCRFPPGWSYLCQTHWQMVPRRLRRLQKAAQRRADARGGAKEITRADRLWRKCVASADRNLGM